MISRYSLVRDCPDGFEYLEKPKPRILRRSPFALIITNLNEFTSLFSQDIDKIHAILFLIEGNKISASILGPALWYIIVPTSFRSFLKIIADNLAIILSALTSEIDEKERLKIAYDKICSDMARTTDYKAIVERLMRDKMITNTRWMVEALTCLVDFAARKLEYSDAAEIPASAVDFFSQPLFGYSGASLYRFNHSSSEWKIVAGRRDEQSFPPDISSINENAIVREGIKMYSVFSILSETYCILLTARSPQKKFTDYDQSFLSIFSTLMASYFKMKILDRDMEEKISEIGGLFLSRELITGLELNRMSLNEAILHLKENLSLDGILFAAPKPNSGKMDIEFSHGTDVAHWENFMTHVLLRDHDQYKDWEISFLIDRFAKNHGAIAFRLNRENPRLYSIQSRILHFFIPQIINYFSEKSLHADAITDSQTKLYNRRYFIPRLIERMNLARTDPGYQLSVAMIDIDQFKQVNDTYGHLVGDMAIRKLGEVLKDMVRDSDIVGRYGGDEFLVILNADMKGAIKVVEKIREAISAMQITENPDIKMTISAGIAHYDDYTWNHDKLITQSDINLYAAKRRRNCVVPELSDL